MRDKIVEQALTWVGTPYIHKARVKQVGVDCAQLVAGIAIDLGLVTPEEIEKIPPYEVEFHLHNREERLLDTLKAFGCVEIPIEQIQPGDILAFKYGRSCSHLGISIGQCQFIHAKYDCGNKRVVVNTLGGEYLPRLAAAFKFPGVE